MTGISAKWFESTAENNWEVSVVYFGDEPREALRLKDEEWGIFSCPEKGTVPSREGSKAGRLGEI